MSQRKRRPSASRPASTAGRDARARTAGSSASARTDRSQSRRAAAGSGAGLAGEPEAAAARRALERAVTGLLVQGPIGFAALAVVAIFLGWLALLSWPVLKPGARAFRVLAVGVVAAAAVTQLLV